MTEQPRADCPCFAPFHPFADPCIHNSELPSSISLGTQPQLVKILKNVVFEYLAMAPRVHPGHQCFLTFSSTSMQSTQTVIVDCLQEIFDEAAIDKDHSLRGACFTLMVEFASRHSYLPSSYILSPSEVPAQEIAGQGSIIDPVTGGGFADVYRAKVLYNHKYLIVAVKRPRKKVLRNMKFSVYKEILLWKQLHHRSILEVIGTCTWLETFPSIVTPWMQSGSISRFMRSSKNKVEYDVKVKWLVQIAEAMVHLHEEFIPGPVIHLDIRCDNILLNDNCQAVLADFGLTKIEDTIFQTIDSTVQSGNPRWTAPELSLSSMPEDLKESFGIPGMKWGIPTTKSDIWSFGMTCIEIATEKLPFSHLGLDGGAISEVYKGKRPMRPVDNPVRCDELWTLAEQCWLSNPEDRPKGSDILKYLQNLSSDLKPQYCAKQL